MTAVAVFSQFGLELPPEVKHMRRLVTAGSDGWRCAHDGDHSVLLDDVLGVRVTWCETCWEDQYAPFKEMNGQYLDLLNVATAAVTFAYLGERDDSVARHARRQAYLAITVDDDSWSDAAARTVKSWVPELATAPTPLTDRRLDRATSVAVVHLAEADDVDQDVRWGLSEAVALGAAPNDLTATAFVASRGESERADADLLAAIEDRVAAVERLVGPADLSVVAVERRRSYEEFWWLTTPAAFIADVVDTGGDDVLRCMVAVPDGVARLVGARRSRGEVVWCLDGAAPASEHEWRLMQTAWVPYLDNTTVVTPLQHPQDAFDLGRTLEEVGAGLDVAAAFADGWPGTGLRLVDAIAGDVRRARWLAEASVLAAQAAMPRHTHLCELVVALAGELPRVAMADRSALVRLCVELAGQHVEPGALVSTLHATVRSAPGRATGDAE